MMPKMVKDKEDIMTLGKVNDFILCGKKDSLFHFYQKGLGVLKQVKMENLCQVTEKL